MPIFIRLAVITRVTLQRVRLTVEDAELRTDPPRAIWNNQGPLKFLLCNTEPA
jgi:hypothetical protein